MRLIVEREREIAAFASESNYRVTARFTVDGADGQTAQLEAELNHRFATADEAQAFLEQCKMRVSPSALSRRNPQSGTPAPPFTTSTLQQDAARKMVSR